MRKSGQHGVALSTDDYEEVIETYQGIKVSWMKFTSYPRNTVISFKDSSGEKRAYVLSFHQKDRELVVGSYLNHVLAEGKAIMLVSLLHLITFFFFFLFNVV